MKALFTTVRILIITAICLVVLVFAVHVVAVAGIYAFNSYKQSHHGHISQKLSHR
ncbi:MAG TPA: hypothetical protein VK961_27590 [Chthoniobacter sp.]|nr:hypothetical protein [Chthoniobacter sp.]